MLCTRIFLHFIRNKPGFTYRYYYRFIEIVGPEKYFHSPMVRNEWDGARYSFDKMFGLVSGWKESFEILEMNYYPVADICGHLNNKVQQEICSLKSHCTAVENDLYSLVKDAEPEDGKNLFDAFIRLKSSIADLELKYNSEKVCLLPEKQLEYIEKIFGIYKAIAEFSDSEKAFALKKLADNQRKRENKPETENKGN